MSVEQNDQVGMGEYLLPRKGYVRLGKIQTVVRTATAEDDE